MTPNVSILLSHVTPVQDLHATQLGDERLNSRHRFIVEKIALAPSASMPETFTRDAELQAYYRFTDNPRFDHHDLLQPHFLGTADRARTLQRVHVIHDTTRLRFDVHDEFEREHLSRFSKNSQGFEWHYALVCAADATRAPLGVIASLPFVHRSDVKGETLAFWQARGGVFDNEMERWLEGVERAEARLGGCERVTHIMDREGDCFELMFAMQVQGYDSIIRSCYDRRVSKGEKRSDFDKLHDMLKQADWLGARTIQLSKRPKSRATKQNPERRKRKADVKVRAVKVELQRPAQLPSHEGARQTVTCWAVEMLETNPPAGEPAARWVLLTSHELGDLESVWEVVDGYQGRWLIEEANKALKTGCSVGKSQQRSADALLKVVALAAPVAWYLLVLRHLSEHAPEVEASQVMEPLELNILRELRPKLIRRKPKVGDVMNALASIGGHKKGNGLAGWLTLERGRRKLAEHVAGARAYMRITGTCDES